MRNLIALGIAALASGCVVYTSDGYVDPDPCCNDVIVNYAPIVVDAEAGCYFDGYYHDDIWYFEADVDDPDGVYDVVSVWADVYDEYAGGEYIESFELFATNDPYIWFSDWLGSSTWLDCFYDGYTVDIVAYDQFDDYDAVTIWPYTY